MFSVLVKIKYCIKFSFQNKTQISTINRVSFEKGKQFITIFDTLLWFHGDYFVIGFTTVHSGVLVVGSVTVVEVVDVAVVGLVVMR